MKKLWKVLIPVLTLAVVLACVFAFVSSADDTAVTIPDGTVAEGSGTKIVEIVRDGASVGQYDTLKAACTAAAQSGDTIKVLIDFKLTNSSLNMGLPAKTVTVDLNGKTVYADGTLTGQWNNTFMPGAGAKWSFISSAKDDGGNTVRGRFVYTDTSVSPVFTMNGADAATEIKVEDIDFIMRGTGSVFNATRAGSVTVKNSSMSLTGAAAFPLSIDGGNAADVTAVFENVDLSSVVPCINIGKSTNSATVTLTDVRFNTHGRFVNVAQPEARCKSSFTLTDCTLVTDGDCGFALKGGKLVITGKETRVNMIKARNFIWDTTKNSDVTLGYGIRFAEGSFKSGDCAQLTAIQSQIVNDGLLSDTYPYVYAASVEVRFNYSDGTTDRLTAASGSTAKAAAAPVAFAKQATIAYPDGKAVIGWSKTEGGELFTGRITDDDIAAGVDFYPVLATFEEAKDVVQAVMFEGTTVAAYVNSDNFHTVASDESRLEANPLANVKVGTTNTKLVFVNDMTVYGAAEINGADTGTAGAKLTKIYFDLNGHKLTADYENWKSNRSYQYIFRTWGLVTSYIYSSVPGAEIDAGKASLIMQNHTHDTIIGADSSSHAKAGENIYKNNLTIKCANAHIVRGNGADGLYVSGVKIETAGSFQMRVLSKTDKANSLTFAIRDCDITHQGSFISYTADVGQTATLNVTIENSTVVVGDRFIADPPEAAVAGANVATNITATASVLYINDATVPQKVTGTVNVTGNEVYVNTADEKLVIGEGKEFVRKATVFRGMTFALKLAVPVPMEVEKAGMTLGDRFVLNLYIGLSNAATAQYKDTAYVTVALPNGETLTLKLTELKVDADGRYIVSVPVAAAEMADKITLTGMLDAGAEGTSYTLSVRDYCDLVLADETTTEKAKTLVKAMLNYGAEAQLVFNYHTDNLANAGLYNDGENPLDGDVTTDAATTVDGAVTGLKTNSMTLSLLDTVTLKLYFRSDKTDAYAFALVTADGDVAITPAEEDDGYRVDIAGILAADLDKTVTLKITNEIDGTTMTVSVCPLAYVSGVLAGESADAEQVKLAKALVLMQLAAADYAAEN